MIRVTVWGEYVQESGELRKELLPSGDFSPEQMEGFQNFVAETSKKIKEVYPLGITGTIAAYLEKCEDMEVKHVNLYMPEYGLSDEVLESTDVLIWWAHIAHDAVPDTIVAKIKNRILRGMGFIALHSAHPCKVMQELLGTSGSLRWREGDFARVWNINPTHPIAQGIPEYFELDPEEMYGERFDIPTPDELIFLSWYRGGEVFRSGCTWNRGYGKIFYFQPGHETNPSYHNPHVMRVIENAVRWAAPVMWLEKLDCPNTEPLEK